MASTFSHQHQLYSMPERTLATAMGLQKEKEIGVLQTPYTSAHNSMSALVLCFFAPLETMFAVL